MCPVWQKIQQRVRSSALAELVTRHPDLVTALAIGLLGACIYLPYLGAFPLWDPWEPHYSQVAWEMQQRGTWLSPYYRDSDVWWSKPILMLWLLRASFTLLWDSQLAFGQHEFCARLPFALVAIAGGILQYDWVRRLFGRRTGALSALVLLTTSQYLLIGRQVMADTLMVVAYSNAMGYLAVGLFATNARPSSEQAGAARVIAFARKNWTFIVFWGLQALAVLAKGFLPPVLAVLVIGSYGLVASGLDDQRPSSSVKIRLLELGQWTRAFLSRIGALWGIPLFLGVAAPWFLYMTVRHGWPYWQQFIFFHHLGRAAGAINLPNSTFDFYLKNLGFALFPWTGFLLGGLLVILGPGGRLHRALEPRSLYLASMVAAPTTFFMLSGSKLAHYIFPVVPSCTIIIAAGLIGLARRGNELMRGRALRNYHLTVALFALVALLVFVALMSDVRHDIRQLLRVFVYYYNRTIPFEYHPSHAILALGLPVVGTTGWLLLSRRVCNWHLVALSVSAAFFAGYLSFVTMPAMAATYSYRPIYDAYRAAATGDDPIGQYNNWPQPERSVLFLFRNRAEHLNSDSAATLFLSRPGRKFVIVDRNRLTDLRRVAKQVNVPLYVVFDDHPYARLLSTEPGSGPRHGQRPHIFGELPAQVTTTDVNFDNKIRFLGWRGAAQTVRRGETVKVAFYYEAIAPIERNWQILIHGDCPTTPGHRINADHFPSGGTIPTSSWQEGRILEDEFEIHIPPGYPFESLFLWTGFFIGKDRMPIANNPLNVIDGRVRGPLLFVTKE